MHLVRHAAGALALALALALSACGGGDGGQRGSGAGPGLGLPINLADCEDWNDAAVGERIATVEQIREFVGGPVQGAGAKGFTLDDEQALEFFDGYCDRELARGFKLYKIYSRAAAFSGPEAASVRP